MIYTVFNNHLPNINVICNFLRHKHLLNKWFINDYTF